MKNIDDYQLRILEKAKISCKDVFRLYGEKITNDLTPSLSARLDSHIDSCNCCEQFTAEYDQVVKIASNLSTNEVPQGVRARLYSNLNRELGTNLK